MASSPFVAKVRGRHRPVVIDRRTTMSITTSAPAKPATNQPTVEQENVSAILTVAAPATRVFAVLADPATHAAIDGTGWVQEAVDRAMLTEVGQVFRMDMYHAGHPDGDYRVVNKVEVLDPPRAIGWMTGTEKGDGELEFGGWIWRYDLAPLGPSETEVTLTYDWSGVPQFRREYIQFPPFGPEHLTNSLHHLAELVASFRLPFTGG
jgi:uncharacterized protein YndB with AHSA1/START domain